MAESHFLPNGIEEQFEPKKARIWSSIRMIKIQKDILVLYDDLKKFDEATDKIPIASQITELTRSLRSHVDFKESRKANFELRDFDSDEHLKYESEAFQQVYNSLSLRDKRTNETIDDVWMVFNKIKSFTRSRKFAFTTKTS